MQQVISDSDIELAEEYDFRNGVRGRYAGRFSPVARASIEAAALFVGTLEWLWAHYDEYRFFSQRDVVWTVQTRLAAYIAERGRAYRVFNGYSLLPRKYTDLVILDEADTVLVAVEFKYEPNHQRAYRPGNAEANGHHDILFSKFPVVFWGSGGVEEDIQRIQTYVATGKSRTAYAIFIDEGGAFRDRPAPPGSAWYDWPLGGDPARTLAVLWTRAVPQAAAMEQAQAS